jgi:heme/copper-type cytochrome/quinol oxidase subunit 2
MIAWCLSVVLMLPIILYSTTVTRPDGKKSCNIMWPSSKSSINNSTLDEEGLMEADGSTFTLYTFTLGFAIPLCLILIFYYLVLRKLRTVGPKTKSKEKKRSHRKVTKLVLTVIAVYILCWTPYWVRWYDDDVYYVLCLWWKYGNKKLRFCCCFHARIRQLPS